jgi:hypothetical protein
VQVQTARGKWQLFISSSLSHIGKVGIEPLLRASEFIMRAFPAAFEFPARIRPQFLPLQNVNSRDQLFVKFFHLLETRRPRFKRPIFSLITFATPPRKLIAESQFGFC